MTESAADMARLMNMVEAIVAEWSVRVSPGGRGSRVRSYADGPGGDPGGRWYRRSLPGAAQSGIGRLAALADRQRGSVVRQFVVRAVGVRGGGVCLISSRGLFPADAATGGLMSGRISVAASRRSCDPYAR